MAKEMRYTVTEKERYIFHYLHDRFLGIFSELCRRLTEESFKFLEYEKPDQYDGEEIERARQQIGFAFAVSMRVSEIGNTDDPTEEDRFKAFVELEGKRIGKDYLMAMN